MKNILLTKLILCFGIFFLLEAKANVTYSIVAKVGNQIITSLDVEHEIRTVLLLSQREINQENVNSLKGYAINEIVKRLVKRNETFKYGVKEYQSNEMEQYIRRYYKNLDTNKSGFKNKLKVNNIDYNFLVKRVEDELLWNKFIVLKYKDKVKINMTDIDNELKKIVSNGVVEDKYKLLELEISNNKNEDINNILKNIYASIKENGFIHAVEKYSISTTSSSKGSLGWVSDKSLSKEYFDALNKLQTGETTNPIVNETSIVLLHVEDIKKIKTEVKDLPKIRNQLINKKKNLKFEQLSRSHYSRIVGQTLIKFK